MLLRLQATIYRPNGTIAQYGYDQKAMHGGMKAPWKIWLPAQEMWVNPLMGWPSSSDTAESAFRKMTFTTPQEAAALLEKQGISYVIEDKPPNYERTYRPSRYFQYADNFRRERPPLSHSRNHVDTPCGMTIAQRQLHPILPNADYTNVSCVWHLRAYVNQPDLWQQYH